jgi:hypothetical protein
LRNSGIVNRNGTRFSLHVVLGRSGLVYAEIDRFNPYQGATGRHTEAASLAGGGVRLSL